MAGVGQWLDALRELTARRRLSLAVGQIAGATALGQIAAMVALPVLTRLYAPESLGIYALLVAITMILSMVTTWRLELAIPLVAEPAEVAGLIRLARRINIGFCVATTAVVTFFAGPLDDLSQLKLQPWLYFLPALVYLTGLFLLHTQALIRLGDYGGVARREVTGSVTTVSVQAVVGFLAAAPGTLLSGLVLGRVVTVWQMSRRTRGSLAGIAPRAASALMRRFHRFCWHFTLAGLLNSLGGQLPVILMGVWFGPAAAGQVGVTYRLLSVPAALVGTAVSSVLLGEMARSNRSAGIVPMALIRATLTRLLPVAALIGLVPLALGPRLAVVVFGPGWEEAGAFAQVLGLVAAASFVASPLAQVLVVLEKSRAMLVLDTSRVVLALGLGFAAMSAGADALGTLVAVCVGLVATYFGYVLAAMKFARTNSAAGAIDLR